MQGRGYQSYLIDYLRKDNMNFNVLAVRAFKTFVQASLAFVATGIVTAIDVPTTKALIAGAVAAGISAVMNLFIQPSEAK